MSYSRAVFASRSIAARTRWSTARSATRRRSHAAPRGRADPPRAAADLGRTAWAAASSRPVRTTSRPRPAYRAASSRPIPRVPPERRRRCPLPPKPLPRSMCAGTVQGATLDSAVAERASARSALASSTTTSRGGCGPSGERRGISLRELARRWNISPSAIPRSRPAARGRRSRRVGDRHELGMSLDDPLCPGGGRGRRRRPRSTSLPVVGEGAREALSRHGVRWEA
jgi:hypothetical protein